MRRSTRAVGELPRAACCPVACTFLAHSFIHLPTHLQLHAGEAEPAEGLQRNEVHNGAQQAQHGNVKPQPATPAAQPRAGTLQLAEMGSGRGEEGSMTLPAARTPACSMPATESGTPAVLARMLPAADPTLPNVGTMTMASPPSMTTAQGQMSRGRLWCRSTRCTSATAKLVAKQAAHALHSAGVGQNESCTPAKSMSAGEREAGRAGDEW